MHPALPNCPEGIITRASRRSLIALPLAALVAASTQVSPALADDDPGSASARLTGQVVQAEVEARPGQDGGTQSLLRLPDGQLTPVDGISGLPSGASVQLTVDIPRALEDEVTEQAGARALDDAREGPAAADSTVARATTEAASAGDVPLQTVSINQIAPAAAAATPAAQSLTIAVVGVAAYSASAYTDSIIASMVGSTSDYWSGQSDGAITFSQSGPVTRYTSSISCSNPSALWNEGINRTGFVPGSNRHLVLLLPVSAYSSGECGYGLGTIGSSVSSGGELYVADDSWPALAHELGHNMSLWHANKLACGTASSDSVFDSAGDPAAGCSVTEYGDGMDVMASSAPSDTGGLSSIGLAKLGLMPSAQVQSVTATGTSSATLVPLSSGAGAAGLRSVRVTDPRTNNVYFLENRQYSGQDTYGWLGLGNRSYGGSATAYGLRVLKQGENGSSVLLDPTPTSGSFDPDAVVRPGTTFLSASGGISITAAQNGNGSVTAAITLAAAVQDHGSTTAEATPTVTTVTAPAWMLMGHPYTLSGSVTSTMTGPAPPTGTVSLQIGNDVRTVSLSSGGFAASYTPAAAGALSVQATYSGATGFAASSATARTTVAGAKLSPQIAAYAPDVSGTAGSKRIDVTVTADDVPATGSVRVLSDAGADVGGGTLNNTGQLRIWVPAPAPGAHSYQVRYLGSDTIDPGSHDVTVTVRKYTSRVRVSLARSIITRRQSASVAVAVVSAGAQPAAGTVTLRSSRDGVLARARLIDGRARLVVPKGLAIGRQYVQVSYSGSSSMVPSASSRILLRVVR